MNIKLDTYGSYILKYILKLLVEETFNFKHI